ncbi:hypothetical protein E5163_04840 [Marinicauda algicola]|uniref:STAS domain-containing protein n=1 Tax=Marinicauda algicola TaxID=2029849 RepID=A0A4S2H4T8_9PROT|nr:hypothetical protein [Marinicauda algicola]TGY90448.1 hypothetical protein E5163_04840 [Marinicauda algicola]
MSITSIKPGPDAIEYFGVRVEVRDDCRILIVRASGFQTPSRASECFEFLQEVLELTGIRDLALDLRHAYWPAISDDIAPLIGEHAAKIPAARIFILCRCTHSPGMDSAIRTLRRAGHCVDVHCEEASLIAALNARALPAARGAPLRQRLAQSSLVLRRLARTWDTRRSGRLSENR